MADHCGKEGVACGRPTNRHGERRRAAPLPLPPHLELLHLLLDRGRHRRVADVGVDLDLEAAPHDAGLEFEVALVGGDDGAPARNLGPHKLRVHALAGGHERHLFRDDSLARVEHLRDDRVAARFPRFDPPRAHFREPDARVHALRPGRVVRVQVPVLLDVVDAAEGHLGGRGEERRGGQGGGWVALRSGALPHPRDGASGASHGSRERKSGAGAPQPPPAAWPGRRGGGGGGAGGGGGGRV